MIGLIKKIQAVRKPKVYTFGEYLRREEKSVGKHEFYDGKIIKRYNVTALESEIAANIMSSIKCALKSIPTTFHVFNSDLKIGISCLNIALYPTASITNQKSEFWQERQEVITNPMLIIDVLPHGLKAFDISRKFEFYKQLPSFQEYVLVNVNKCAVETRFQEEPNLWRIRHETNIDNSVTLHALGVSISMADIYEDIVFPVKK